MSEIYNSNGWIIKKTDAGYSVSYRPPGVFGKTYTGNGESEALAFLSLPQTVRCLPAAERFLTDARSSGLKV